MDRSWIKSRMFSKEHMDGVNEFMTFVSERFTDDEEILCPCRRCLNRVHNPRALVEDHLYIHGMTTTYTRWVHHGEPLEVAAQEIGDQHVDEHTSHNEDFGMNLDEEDDPDDGIHGMVQELYSAEEEGQGKKSMFAILLEEMKQELYPGAECTRFSFVSQFTIDADVDPVKDAFSDLLKKGQRQMRYALKKKYFNGIPANEVRTTSPLTTMTDIQWKQLVDMWSDPKHKEKCLKNQDSHGLVKLHQTRSYVAQYHVMKQTKFKDTTPTAIDVFKDTHCSSKSGFDEITKDVIAQMEAYVAQPTEEGEDPKTPAEAVAHVLPNSTFLRNIGMQSTEMKRNAKSAAMNDHVHDLESKLEAEKMGSAELRSLVADLEKQLEEQKDATRKTEEETEKLKQQSEIKGFLRSLFGDKFAQE